MSTANPCKPVQGVGRHSGVPLACLATVLPQCSRVARRMAQSMHATSCGSHSHPRPATSALISLCHRYHSPLAARIRPTPACDTVDSQYGGDGGLQRRHAVRQHCQQQPALRRAAGGLPPLLPGSGGQAPDRSSGRGPRPRSAPGPGRLRSSSSSPRAAEDSHQAEELLGGPAGRRCGENPGGRQQHRRHHCRPRAAAHPVRCCLF